MPDRLFLYIDILGFKEMIRSGADVADLYKTIDELNVHRHRDFRCIVFSDTIVVYGHDGWLEEPSTAIMWLIEFAQDLFYRLIIKDTHFRAYITLGQFEHRRLTNIEAYYGDALVECYEREKEINCVGVFLDSRLAHLSHIFKLTPYNDSCHFVHVMQHLDEVRYEASNYPIPGELIEATSMHFWIAYLFRYLENIKGHSNDALLPEKVREKYRKAWEMIGERHPDLLRILASTAFDYRQVADLDWTEARRRIGTDEGAWG